MADHDDPNAVNSIFSDIDISAADLYDRFGFPSPETDAGEKVVIALTFASVPAAGVFNTYYRAATISKACAGNGVADRYFKLATEINPNYECFHVHRNAQP